jgi:asparagine synthase (glutamine-hydrolysing)
MEVVLDHEGWRWHGPVAVRGRAFDGLTRLRDAQLAERFAGAVAGGDSERTADDTLAAVAAVAADLAGFYAAVVDPPGPATYLVADRARSIPLYYGDGVVSDDGETVAQAIDADRDPVTAAEFLLTRYVAGPDTIWQGVHSTQAGEVVRVGTDTRRRNHCEVAPDERAAETGADATAALDEAFETAMARLLAVAGERRVVVPLSGGYDSRLLVAALAERSHPVTAFAFGRPGHPDVEMSREVAARLGIDWELVAYDRADWQEWYHGPSGQRLRERAFAGDALPFLAAQPAARRLVESGRVPADALWCPGHAVSTLGERLPAFVGNMSDGRAPDCASDESNEQSAPTLDGLIEHILDSQYTLWEWSDPAFAAAARERIERGLLGGRPGLTGPASAAAAFERWAWRGRQTTFTTGDVRGYEAAGLDWWLPLWDPAYVRAWQRLSLAARHDRRAHRQLATERYRRVADPPAGRADITDRSLAPVDRLCARARHTPARVLVEHSLTSDGVTQTPRDRIEWEPSFLTPRSAWHAGDHPLSWDGILAPALREQVPTGQSLYAIRTLARLRGLDLGDPETTLPDSARVTLPTGDTGERS